MPLTDLIERAQQGDKEAFGEIVGRFQDMAVSSAYEFLRDRHLAEDVAQEAFIQAFTDLRALRSPEAFPAWFRRIVLKYCDRLTRKKRVRTTPLSVAGAVASTEPTPDQELDRRERRRRVMAAVKALPAPQRSTTTLHYVGGLSQKEVAEFMEVPLTTVKKRLHASRKAMRARMLYMDGED